MSVAKVHHSVQWPENDANLPQLVASSTCSFLSLPLLRSFLFLLLSFLPEYRLPLRDSCHGRYDLLASQWRWRVLQHIEFVRQTRPPSERMQEESDLRRQALLMKARLARQQGWACGPTAARYRCL